MLEKVYVLSNDGVYEGDYTHSIEIYRDSANAQRAYEAWVAKALNDCTTSDGTKPEDITDVDPDEVNDNYDGQYVYEQHHGAAGGFSTQIYLYGSYADDHIEILLQEAEIKDGPIANTAKMPGFKRKHL